MKSPPAATAPAAPDGFEVLDASHRETLQQLDALQALMPADDARTLDAAAQERARNVIAFFTGEGRQHNADEERHVFPALRDCGDAALRHAVDQLSEDHAWIEIHWLEVQAQLDAALSGSRAFSGAALREAAAPFLALSREHIAAEERLLYPQARKRMAPRQVRSMTRDLTARVGRARR